VEEQRFCWSCKTWFHSECLLPGDTTTQADHLHGIFSKFSDIPRSILEVSYQPTARGGSLHFISGNIRLVNAARQLLDKQKREDIIARPDPWFAANIETHMENESSLWWEYLIYENNINEEEKDAEKLFITDQRLYTCPICGLLNWL
jgi:hypothetical protein